MNRHYLTSIGVVVLLLIAGCAGQTPFAGSATQANTQTNGSIHVTGSGSADAEPNQAIVQVAVTTTAADAVSARQQLAENTSDMRAALEELGISESQITTTRYDLDRDRRHPRREDGEPRIRYRAYHGFKITVNQTDRVGAVIDTAVQNGATAVEDVQFTLTTDRRRQLEADARRAAMTDARQKAEQLAAEANLTITGVKVIRTTQRSAPRQAEHAATATPAPTHSRRTDLESGPVTVVATVHVVYETAPAQTVDDRPSTGE